MNLVQLVASEENAVKKCDIVGSLPNEISYKILMALTPHDIINVFKCNKKWSRGLNSANFWKSKLRKDYTGHEEDTENEIYSNFIKKFSSLWQGRYLYNFGLQFNIENNIVQRVVVSIRNYDKPFNIVHVDERSLIYFYVNEKNIYVADCGTGEVKQVFTHSYIVSSAVKHGSLLIAVSSFNEILNVWDMETESRLVVCDIFSNRYPPLPGPSVAACKHLVAIITSKILPYRYRQLYIYDLKTMTLRRMFRYRYAYCNDNFIAMVENDGVVAVSDVNLEKFTTIAGLNCAGLFKIIMNNNFLVKAPVLVASACSKAVVWSIETKTLFSIPDVNRCQLISQHKLMCKKSPTNWEMWNLETQKLHFVICSPIMNITLNSNFLFTTSFNLVNIWCMKTGRGLQSFQMLTGQYDEHRFKATEKKLVFTNSGNKTREIKSLLVILDYKVDVKNHLKQR